MIREETKKNFHAKKHLLIEIDEQIHKEVKMWAAFRHESIKRWVTSALVERLKEENKHNE